MIHKNKAWHLWKDLSHNNIWSLSRARATGWPIISALLSATGKSTKIYIFINIPQRIPRLVIAVLQRSWKFSTYYYKREANSYWIMAKPAVHPPDRLLAAHHMSTLVDFCHGAMVLFSNSLPFSLTHFLVSQSLQRHLQVCRQGDVTL